jgi:hypothetical protein
VREGFADMLDVAGGLLLAITHEPIGASPRGGHCCRARARHHLTAQCVRVDSRRVDPGLTPPPLPISSGI